MTSAPVPTSIARGASKGTSAAIPAAPNPEVKMTKLTDTQLVILSAAAGREWHGEAHTVIVLEDGFHWKGTRWRSLSVIARDHRCPLVGPAVLWA